MSGLEASDNRVYKVGDLEVVPSNREAKLGGAPLHLRPKTFDLLVFLIANRERLLTKEELLDALWSGTSVSRNSLVQCVIELRKALGDDAKQPRLIKTVDKTGYRFIGRVEEISLDPRWSILPRIETGAVPVMSPAAPTPPAAGSRKFLWIAAAGMVLIVGLLVWRLWPRPPVELSLSEVAWWKLDEGSGNRIKDVVSGMEASIPAGVSWTSGITGSALLFDGGAGPVRGKDPGIMPRGTAARTLIAWLKTDQSRADSTVIFHYGNPIPDSRSDAFALFVHENGKAAVAPGIQAYVGDRIDDGRWHQVAGVFEGSPKFQLRVFVDGKEQSAGTVPEELLQRGGSAEWSIGRALWGGTNYRGAVDDVRVYERALRPAEVQALHRCGSGRVDLLTDTHNAYFFSSVYQTNTEISQPAAGETSARIRNPGLDFAGVTFVRTQSGCAVTSLRASDMGQDLNIKAELRVAGGPAGEVVEGGPFFRCRASQPGDGILGGESAGFWIQLRSNGQIRVFQLHPAGVIAFSPVIEGFDASSYHQLEVAVKDQIAEVALDGRVLTFDQGGTQRLLVTLSAPWSSTTPQGKNRGSAGLAFGATSDRKHWGGQEARNIEVRAYHPLH